MFRTFLSISLFYRCFLLSFFPVDAIIAFFASSLHAIFLLGYATTADFQRQYIRGVRVPMNVVDVHNALLIKVKTMSAFSRLARKTNNKTVLSDNHIFFATQSTPRVQVLHKHKH